MLPVFDDEWDIAAPPEVGLDAALIGGLDRFVRQWPKHNVHAVLVARRGKLADLATAFAGLRLRPRDLAKFGQLMLDRGRWNGRQIVPSKWISESMRPYANIERHGALFYGYHWWLGRSLLRGSELSWVAGFGAGGQRLFVLPELDLVVVINAFNYSSPVSIGILNGFVLPAIRDDLL